MYLMSDIPLVIKNKVGGKINCSVFPRSKETDFVSFLAVKFLFCSNALTFESLYSWTFTEIKDISQYFQNLYDY